MSALLTNAASRGSAALTNAASRGSSLFSNVVGSSSQNPGTSALAIKNATGTNRNGVYWINLPTVGATQVYCIMDSNVCGGGWMLALKATRGATFSFSSNYWTTTNTLNPTDNTIADGDAKYHTFNYFPANDFLAIWPDIPANYNGSASGGTDLLQYGWTWFQPNVNNAGTTTTAVNLFNTASNISLNANPRGWNGVGTAFSTQLGNQFYGINFTQNASATTLYARWGFGWNNENDWNSDDVTGGIGLTWSWSGQNASYSAGDFIGCCAGNTGINRSARVLMLVRETYSTLDGSTSAKAAPSAQWIKWTTGTQTDGVYWINLPTVGATQIYCLMDSKWAGGGWMMLMKGTRGTTFNYNSAYWTAVNTLNPSDNTRNDADAKYSTFNYSVINDVMAIWPDLGVSGGSIANTGTWTWLSTNYNYGTPVTALTGFNSNSRDVNETNNPLLSSGWNATIWSQQVTRRYVMAGGSHVSASAPVRWGYLWNNETDFLSIDVQGGIGMSYNSYSAGDTIGCCNITTGINRTARFELYGR